MASSPIPLPPPPPGPAPSIDPLWAFYTQWAAENRFFIKRSRVNSRDGDLRQVYAQCDRSGAYRPHRPDEGKENTPTSTSTSTRLTNCPFSIVFSVCKKVGLWTARVRNPHHNHGPALLSSIPTYRAAMTAQYEYEIVDLLQRGYPARQIVLILEARHRFPVVSRTNVYEVNRRLKTGGAGPRRASTAVPQGAPPVLLGPSNLATL